MNTATITPLPLKADFRAVVTKAKEPAKDPTAALRQKRARAKRKALALAVATPVPPIPTVTVAALEKPNDVKPSVTVRHVERHSADARRTSWSLVALAYGFFCLGVSINIWNAWSAENIADTALPAAMGVLAEGVVFFLPARAIALPVARRMLAFALLLFVSAFALTNSLRMASIIAADQTAARADRQTVGVVTADHAATRLGPSGTRHAPRGKARRLLVLHVRRKSRSWRTRKSRQPQRLPRRPSRRQPTSPASWRGSAWASSNRVPGISTCFGFCSGRSCRKSVGWC